MTKNLHHSYIFLNFFFLLSIVFDHAFSTDNFTLSSTESFTFSSNRSIVSTSDVFELGIFKLEPIPQDADRWYLGIWFKRISERTYVWVANRNYPLSNPVGTIRLWNSKLVLLDQSNILVWSTNIAKQSKTSPIVATLHDDGNFELTHSGEILWQSFESPTDTLLAGMKLSWDLGTKDNNLLRSWKSITDPSNGNFSYGFEDPSQTQGVPMMFLWSNGIKRNQITPWSGVDYVGVPVYQPSVYFLFTLLANKEVGTFSFQVADSGYTSIMRLSPEGYIQHLMWNKTSYVWDILWNAPYDKCDVYKFCGPYTYCELEYECHCMKGFEPKNREAWNLQNRGDGCVRKTPLSCSDFFFFELIDIKLPDTTEALVESNMGFIECKHRCENNCSCTAFTIVNQYDIIVNRYDRSSCMIWTGELLNVRQYVEDRHHLFVKQGLPEKDKKPNTKLIIGLSVFALGCIVSVILICYWRINKKRAKARGAQAVATSVGHS